MNSSEQVPWLILIQQIPQKPAYLRVKIWRRLQGMGAVAIKNGVYILPNSGEKREDFEWIFREIIEGGGEASLCEARFVEGLNDEQVRGIFQAARDADYAQIVAEARAILESPSALTTPPASEQIEEVSAQLKRFKKRVAGIRAIDFFSARGQESAASVLASLESRVREMSGTGDRDTDKDADGLMRESLRARTWVTRKGIFVDRIACAWLIRRFIDQEARFKFVTENGYLVEPEEFRFDMFEGEFTHEGDRCSFEVILDRLGLDDPALQEIGEIVHELDMKDQKFGRDETAGIRVIMEGLAEARKDDESRLERGSAILDDLYEFFTCRGR